MKEGDVNWGPKPFRMLKCWEDMAGYEEFVKNEWGGGLHVEGWKGFVLKEKFKGIKAKLKECNKEHCGNFDAKINKAKSELHSLDLKGEARMLTLEKVEERRFWSSKIHRLSTLNCSMLWQKSRMK